MTWFDIYLHVLLVVSHAYALIGFAYIAWDLWRGYKKDKKS